MTKQTRERLEAIIRFDAENQPYKYRDIRASLLLGRKPYLDLTEEEINDTFTEFELEITEQDREWASYDIEEYEKTKTKEIDQKTLKALEKLVSYCYQTFHEETKELKTVSKYLD